MGRKVMVTMHVAPPASVRPHVLVWVNSGAELTVSAVMLIVVVPVLVNVNTCDDAADPPVDGKTAVPLSVAPGGAATSNALLVTDTLLAPMVRDAVRVSAA